jgi:hypothetical protein
MAFSSFLRSMRRPILGATCVSLFLMASALGAFSQTGGCAETGEVESQLKNKFGEIEFGIGVSDSHAFKFFHNPKSKTWTVVAIQPNGIACIIAAGESLELSRSAESVF